MAEIPKLSDSSNVNVLPKTYFHEIYKYPKVSEYDQEISQSQTRSTVEKNHRTFTVTRHPKDNKRLFLVKMVANLERTPQQRPTQSLTNNGRYIVHKTTNQQQQNHRLKRGSKVRITSLTSNKMVCCCCVYFVCHQTILQEPQLPHL